MSLKNFSFLIVACVSLTFFGCESQRYKPADWPSADNSTLPDRRTVEDRAKGASGKRILQTPSSPTNWIELSGTGGEASAARTSWGTLPSRYRGTSLPGRSGTSMPWRNSTSLPGRQGTSLPRRGYGANTSLPTRQNGAPSKSSGTTVPTRKSGRSGSTLPDRRSVSPLPRR